MAHSVSGRRVGAVAVVIAVLASVLATYAPVMSAATVSGSATPACGADGTPGVAAVHNPNFYIDSGQGNRLFSQYAGYTVRAGGGGAEGLWMAVEGSTGGVVRLADGEAPSQLLPTLAGGQSTTRFFLLTADQSLASGGSSVAQRHRVVLYRGSPATGGVPLCARDFTYGTVSETIKALANKVTSITTTGAGAQDTAVLGDQVVVTVTGDTGQVGSGPTNDPGVIDYTPNALFDFPAAAWRLERTELTISPDGVAPATTFVNRLFITAASGANRSYTARYTFRAVAPTTQRAVLKPIQYIASGTQVKHTDLGTTPLFELPAVSPVADVSLSKSAGVDVIGADGGPVRYVVEATNAGSTTGWLDEIVDRLPAGAAYVPGSARLDGAAVAEPDLHDGSLILRGPVPVPPSGRTTFSYDLDLGPTPGGRTNAVVATYGTNSLDRSRDVFHTEPASAVVTVLGADGQGPTAVDDRAATGTNTAVALDVLGNDSSPAGLPLEVASFTQPGAAGAVSRSDDQLTFVPASSFAGRATFTYTVTDGYGTSTATVEVDVAPTANDDRYGGPPTTEVRTYGSVLANDVCPSCTVGLVTGPAAGTLTLRPDGTFDYAQAVAGQATVTFTYRATLPAPGGRALTVTDRTATATLVLANVAPDFATTPHATAVGIHAISNDNCSNCAVQNTGGTVPANGTWVRQSSPNTGWMTYTPYATRGGVSGAAPFWGIDRFDYQTTANMGSGVVTVLVGPPAQTVTALSGGPEVLLDLATGVCSGCSLSFSAATAPTLGSVSLSASGQLRFAPPQGAGGVDSFTYRVREPVSGLTTTGIVNLRVGPEAVDDHHRASYGGTVAASVLDNDACASACSVTLVSGPTKGTLVGALHGTTGAFTYQAGSAVGEDRFTYRITSSAAPGVDSTATVVIDVDGGVADHAETGVDQAVAIPVLANDPCAPGCALGAVGQPAVGTAAIEGGLVRYVPASGFSGRVTFEYTLTQGGGSTTVPVTVDVRPLAVDDVVVTGPSDAVVVRPLDNDLCAGCSVTAISDITSGTVEVETGGRTVRYTPAGSGPSTASFHYTITDASGLVASAAVLIEVVAPPSLHDRTATTAAGTPVLLDVVAEDSCPGCSVEVDVDPARGAVAPTATGLLLYQPRPGTSGIDAFTYRATDGGTGATGTATVTVTVTPIAVDDVARTPVGTAVVVPVGSNDACTDCTTSVLDEPGSEVGVTSVEGTGIRLEPDPAFVGTATFRYRSTDPSTGAFSEALVTVVVDDATPDGVTTPFDTPVVGLNVLANDRCEDCELTHVGTTTGGSAEIDGPATISFVPQPGFSGPAEFSYTAAAPDGGPVVSSTVTVLVAPGPRVVTLPPSGPATGSLVPVDGCAGCEFSVAGAPLLGELDLDGGGSFSYWPPDQPDEDSFGYVVSHRPSGLTVHGTVTVVLDQPAGLAVRTVFVEALTGVAGPDDRLDAGDELHYDITVGNLGSDAAHDVRVEDPGATVDCGEVRAPTERDILAELPGGDEVTCSAVLVLDQAQLDAGEVHNQASASIADDPSTSVTSEVVTTPLAASPSLTLTTVVALGRPDADACAEATSTLTTQAGATVTYCFRVGNTGNVTLPAVEIDDPQLDLVPGGSQPDLLAGAVPLAPGATVVLAEEATASATSTNTATASASAPGSVPVASPVASATVTVQPTATTTTTTTTPPVTTTPDTTTPDTTTPDTTTPDTTVPDTTTPDTTVPDTTVPDTTTPDTTVPDTTVPPTTPDTTVPDTTVPPTTVPVTTPPTTAPEAPGLGAVRGLVWFDRNGDGRFDQGEWPLPNTPLVIERLDEAAVAANGAAAADAAPTVVTDAEGRYHVGALPPGVYRVSGTLTARGTATLDDTDGQRDWLVQVEVVAGATADADFSALGSATLTGVVRDLVTKQPTADAWVECRWAGVDDELGTADDVTVTVRADANGAFELTGVPFGVFRCQGTDPVTGRASAGVEVVVNSADVPAEVDLPIGGPATPTPTPAPAPAPAPRRQQPLPVTGGEQLLLLAAGLVVFVAGLGLRWWGRTFAVRTDRAGGRTTP